MLLSPEAFQTHARRIRLLLFDVDGVLTDGSLTLHPDGSESKTFYIKDGAAFVRARQEGLLVGLLSGRTSGSTSRRAAELGVSIVLQGQADKAHAYDGILADHHLTDEQVAFMGDDLGDLAVLARAGLSAAPADAAEQVRSQVHWVSQKGGGRGAVRELVDLVLQAQGR